MNKQNYRSRGYLPHLEIPDSTYFITLRLADTLPQNVLDVFRSELKVLHGEKQNQKLGHAEEQRLKYLQTKKIQDYLDAGYGECWLKRPSVAAMIEEAVRHHDGDKYICHVCCITFPAPASRGRYIAFFATLRSWIKRAISNFRVSSSAARRIADG
jgi:hypothetical protein